MKERLKQLNPAAEIGVPETMDEYFEGLDRISKETFGGKEHLIQPQIDRSKLNDTIPVSGDCKKG